MREVLFVETGTIHAGIQFDMYGESFDPMFIQRPVEIFENVQRVDLRFEVEHDHVVKGFPFGVHDGNRDGNSRGP